MALVNLLDLEVNKVSRDIKDYSLLITAPSGYGKSPFLAELYGDRALFLAFENSHKGLAGIHAVTIDSFTTLEYYLAQLENPMVREKFDVVVIDTLFLFDASIEKSITDSYGKDLIGDCLAYNKGYKIVDKKFLTALKRIQRMNYTLAYVCHPTEKKVKLPDGSEIVKIEPKVSDRIKDLLIPEVDVRLFCHYDQEGNKVIYTQSSPFFDARVRVGDMDSIVPFDAEALKKAFAEGIDRRVTNKDLLVDNLESKNIVDEPKRDFKTVMEELMALGNELGQAGLGVEANSIVDSELGCDSNGKQRTLAEANDKMIPALETIIVKLKAVKEKNAPTEQ